MPRKSDVWFTYGLFMLRAGFAKTEILYYKSFLHLWNADFCWLKTRKAKTVDSGCTTCEDLEVMFILRHAWSTWWIGNNGAEDGRWLA